MFDINEYQQLFKVYEQCLVAIQVYRRVNNVSLSETPLHELYQPLFRKYRELAAVELQFDVSEVIQRHYLARWKQYKHEAA